MRRVGQVLLAVFVWQAALEPVSADTAIFAGGCFWCLEADLADVPGVTDAQTGYIGGGGLRPTEREVRTRSTGYLEAVRVTWDPARTSYAALLHAYWTFVDPTDAGGQACERGPLHRTAIFHLDPAQRRTAEASRARVERILGQPVVTQVRHAGAFWPAEERFQDYARKYPRRYDFYRRACGRDARLREVWGEDREMGPAPGPP